MREAVTFVNEYAPEHLEVQVREPFALLPQLKNAGEILIGPYTPFCTGNYCVGTNAVLPTGGFAHTYSCTSVYDFLKRTGLAYLTREGYAALSETTRRLAEFEGFPAHANAVTKQFGLRSVPSLGLNNLAAEMANAPGGGVASAPLLSSHETDVIGFAPVPSQRWAVMVAEDQAIFTADVSDLSRTQFFNAFVLALIISGLVIFVGRAFDTTERESLSDPLTGLANRRFLQEILLRELRRAQRSNQPVALMIVDIDHFKAVNDTYGHNAGDEMLEQLAGIMISSVRATDFVVRYGGEEFVILLPETRLVDALQVAEKLRKTIGETVMESTAKPGVTLTCTVSAGVSTYPLDAASAEGLILKADRALYFAKQNGRNRVVTVAEVDAPPAAVASIKN